MSADRTLLTVAFGSIALRTATAPATCGAAIEVPVASHNIRSPGIAEQMYVPGAKTWTIELEFEPIVVLPNTASWPGAVKVVLPTVMAFLTRAGNRPPADPSSFPEATTVAVPTRLRVSIQPTM